MYYLKMPNNIRFNFIDNGVNQLDSKTLTLTFYNENRFKFEDIKKMFSDLIDGITVWMCIVQDDGTETDEMVSVYYKEYTELKGLEYQMDCDVWKVTLSIPDETKERLADLEAAMNFLLIGN